MRERQGETKERSCLSRKGPLARTILEVFMGKSLLYLHTLLQILSADLGESKAASIRYFFTFIDIISQSTLVILPSNQIHAF